MRKSFFVSTEKLDERHRMIILDVRRRIGGNRRIEIPFSDISGFSIGRQGDRSDGSVYYDLVVNLNTGKEIYLFGGCVFEGRMNRILMEDLRARFEKISERAVLKRRSDQTFSSM